MIYFHCKTWNHWVIYSYFGYIRRYAPLALLLCCDNIKDCSIAAANVLAKFAELSENRWQKFKKFSEYQIKLITATRKYFGKLFHRFSNTFEEENCLVKIFYKKTSSLLIFHSLQQRTHQKAKFGTVSSSTTVLDNLVYNKHNHRCRTRMDTIR